MCANMSFYHCACSVCAICMLQVLTHDGASVKGKSDIMSKLTSIVELHMAFGMSYRTQHTDFTCWHEDTTTSTTLQEVRSTVYLCR